MYLGSSSGQRWRQTWGWPSGHQKTPPMPVLQTSEVPNQVGDGEMASRMCVGCSWVERTSRRHSASSMRTSGVRGTLPVQQSSACRWLKRPAPPGMEMPRFRNVPSRRCQQYLEVQHWDGEKRAINLSTLESQEDRKEMT